MNPSLPAGHIDRPIAPLWPRRWLRAALITDAGKPPSPDYLAAILDATPYTSPEILLRML